MGTDKPGWQYLGQMSFEEVLIRFVRTRNEEVSPELPADEYQSQSTRILYEPDVGQAVEFHLINHSLWMSLEQIARLYQRHTSGIGRHVTIVLDEFSPFSYRHVGTFKPGAARRTLKIYDLEIIVRVGQRISPRQAALLRKWAKRVLEQPDR